MWTIASPPTATTDVEQEAEKWSGFRLEQGTARPIPYEEWQKLR